MSSDKKQLLESKPFGKSSKTKTPNQSTNTSASANDTASTLRATLWNIADTLRGKMDADDFRDYILGFIFYKYLSEKMHAYAKAILKPDKLKYQDIEKHNI